MSLYDLLKTPIQIFLYLYSNDDDIYDDSNDDNDDYDNDVNCYYNDNTSSFLANKRLLIHWHNSSS